MSLELVPDNTIYQPGSVFSPSRQAILNHIPRHPSQEARATSYVARNAPDLLGMLGLTA